MRKGPSSSSSSSALTRAVTSLAVDFSSAANWVILSSNCSTPAIMVSSSEEKSLPSSAVSSQAPSNFSSKMDARLPAAPLTGLSEFLSACDHLDAAAARSGRGLAGAVRLVRTPRANIRSISSFVTTAAPSPPPPMTVDRSTGEESTSTGKDVPSVRRRRLRDGSPASRKRGSSAPSSKNSAMWRPLSSLGGCPTIFPAAELANRSMPSLPTPNRAKGMLSNNVSQSPL